MMKLTVASTIGATLHVSGGNMCFLTSIRFAITTKPISLIRESTKL